jgi:hypothetical protein
VNDALLASLDRIRMRATAAAAAFDDAVALLPVEATGGDGTGAVTARLGPDGVPTALRVASDWARRVAPEQFGPAVVDACRAAAAQRAAEWSRRLDRTGWRARADARLAHPDPARARTAPTDPRPAVPPRPLAEIGRDAHAALRDATRPAAPRSGAGIPGPAGGDRLTLTLTPTGLTGCAAQPRWVAGQTGAMLTNALSAALADARGALDATVDGGGPACALDRLLTEAMAAMAAVTTMTTMTTTSTTGRAGPATSP